MKRHHKRAWILIGILAIAGALASVGAYAYFTNNGSGTGQATVGTSTGILLSSTSVGPLYPGSGNVPVTVNISNPGAGAQYVGTVSGTVADNGSCDGAWFVVDSVAYNGTLAAGGNDTANTNIRMLDSGTNQDACKNATMTINWSSN